VVVTDVTEILLATMGRVRAVRIYRKA